MESHRKEEEGKGIEGTGMEGIGMGRRIESRGGDGWVGGVRGCSVGSQTLQFSKVIPVWTKWTFQIEY